MLRVSRTPRASRRQITLLGALCAVLGILAACLERPPSFRLVTVAEARELLDAGASLIDVRDPGRRYGPSIPGGTVWRLLEGEVPEPPELAPGVVVVVADTESLGYRAAGALASVRNPCVAVVISESAEERGRLYALDPQQKEIPRGRDS